MKELKRGDTLQVTIEAATVDGTGIARVDGQVVFVPGALPGELCRICIAHIGRSAVFAELLRVEQPSAHRVEPDCPYFPLCGGCALRHMDYEQELALKQAHVQSCLTRIGGQTISALPITGAAQTNRTKEEMEAEEFLPFQSGIEAGVDMIMVGHITAPNLTDGDSLPASISEKIITGVLRNELGYQGIIITDAMNMGAITEYYKSDVAAIMALKAGADMVLMPENFEEAYQGVLDAVVDGTVSEERIDDSLRRIYRVKLRSRVL